MADRKITELTALAAGSQATGDLLTIVDVSEGAAVDKNKKITVESLLKGIPSDIGIGITNPAAKLAIHTTTTTNSSSQLLRITSANGALFGIETDETVSNPTWKIGGIVSGGTAEPLAFYQVGSEVARIDSSGRVGIGTTSPARNLHVHGSDSDTVQIHLTNSTTGATSNDGFSVALGSDESGILNMRENNPMRFFTNDTERMRINSSGNVGIGTLSPSEEFVVRADAPSIQLESSNANGRNYGFQANNDGKFHAYDATAGANRITLDSSGNVGIGTTTIEANSNYNTLEIVGDTSSGGGVVRLKTGDRSTAKTMLFCDTGGFEARVETNHPIVFSTNNTEEMRLLSGGGLTFNGDTSQANALDDYEEGTWTPSVSSSGGTITTVGTRSGRYTKIGRLVTVHFIITITTAGTAAGTYLYFDNLPFTVSNTHNQVGVCREQAVNGFLSTAQVTGNATSGAIIRYDNNGVIVNGGNYQCTITYEAQ